ncbi:hypothetical protein AC578_4541 [Pseudocercospora eumusae]|uniref:Exoribonuclease phosphorolytic domain-containing protein n=1 Tax=Pseudocercospora eumusae TaxID=321146 RepID=A0A139HGP2_9PEZI|nr:hypothetical protein AC578_4541 [Pseudocercospora eumusae]
MGPELLQHPLSRADGSSIFSDGLYTIIAGVNGPVEVQRRDELPEEAAIEVNFRPSSGVGGPRERWLEGIIQNVLRSILLVHLHPRTLFQFTIQVSKQPETQFRRTTSDIAILPALINAALTAAIDGGLPLATTTSAVLAVVTDTGKVVVDPSEKEVFESRSIHATAFNQHGEQLLDESSGIFDINTWGAVVDASQQACAAAIAPAGDDAAMTNGDNSNAPWLRETLEEQARKANAWREKT